MTPNQNDTPEATVKQRTFTSSNGEERTVRFVVKTCVNCGGAVEVPPEQADNGNESFCSIGCVEDYDGE